MPAKAKAQTPTFCGQTVTVVLTSANISTLFPGGGAWPTGSIIGVSGTLTIDQSTTFGSITFIMGPGAAINVQGNGIVLTAIATQFTACRNDPDPKMWTGITIQSGASINFLSATIRDAFYGLRFLSTANGTANSISGCFMLNNMYGIGIFSHSLFRPILFANNTIKRETPATILPPPPGRSYTGSRLHRGIWITSSTVDLATGATNRNFIQDYRFGVWNFSSTVTLANMTLRSQSNDPILTDTLDGTGIFSWQSNLIVGGAGTANCIFQIPENSGIISRNTRSLAVSGAFFDNPAQYGIRCAQSIALSAPIRILANKFDLNAASPRSAIYVERPPSGPTSTNVFINLNTIRRNNGHDKHAMVMIDVQGKVPAFDITLISDNPIDIDRGWPQFNGIRVTGKGRNYHILNNKNLTWDPNSSPSGQISLLQSRGIIANDLMDGLHLITGNTITSTLLNDKSYLRAGIFMENNPLAVLVCDNITNATHKGIECRGNLASTILTKNSMGEAAYGLYCEAGNAMPNQDRQENVWTASSYFNWGARYNAASAPFTFFYDPSNVIPNDLPPTFLPVNLFDDEPGSKAVCGFPMDTTYFPGGGISNYEQDYINGVIPPNTTAKNWDTRQRLLYKFFQLPELLISNTSASNYFSANQTSNSSPYRFAQAEYYFDQAYTLSSTVAGQFASASTQIQTLSAQIEALDVQQAQDTTTYDLVIAQQRATAFVQLSSAATSLELLRTQANPTLQLGLQTALTYANTLPTAMPYEDNLKDILVFAIRSAIGDSLVETDFARLRQIAAQCPSVGGISVRRAPQWLLHEEGIDYSDKDWDSGCAATYYDDAKSRINTAQTMLVNPNPANDYLEVVFPEKAGGKWFVSDAKGRTLRQGSVEESTLWIPTNEWLSGFYFLIWRDENGFMTTSKVIVAH